MLDSLRSYPSLKLILDPVGNFNPTELFDPTLNEKEGLQYFFFFNALKKNLFYANFQVVIIILAVVITQVVATIILEEGVELAGREDVIQDSIYSL